MRAAGRTARVLPEADDRFELARTGDPEAFRLVFERYCRPITSFIFDMVNQRELAEELAQETFVRAYRGLHRMQAETKISTWLFGIAKNVAYELLRTRRRRQMVAIDEIENSPPDETAPQPDGELLDKELNAVIQSAIEALDDDKRVVFTLKILQQKSYEEISAITGSSIPKLKTDLHRARAEMRRRIGPYVECDK